MKRANMPLKKLYIDKGKILGCPNYTFDYYQFLVKKTEMETIIDLSTITHLKTLSIQNLKNFKLILNSKLNLSTIYLSTYLDYENAKFLIESTGENPLNIDTLEFGVIALKPILNVLRSIIDMKTVNIRCIKISYDRTKDSYDELIYCMNMVLSKKYNINSSKYCDFKLWSLKSIDKFKFFCDFITILI